MPSPAHLRAVLDCQAHLAAWKRDHIDFLATTHVQQIDIASATDEPERVVLTILLHDRTYLQAGLTIPIAPSAFATAVEEVIRRAESLRGLGPAFDGADIQSLSEEECAARIEHYLVTHPGLRWDRTWDYVERYCHTIHLRLAPQLATVGARLVRIDERTEKRAVRGLLCAGPEGEALFVVAAMFPSRAAAEEQGMSGYRLHLRCDPSVPKELRVALLASAQGALPTGLADLTPRLEAMAKAVVAHFPLVD